MKTLKISLAVLVVAAMGTGVFFWLQSINEPKVIKPPVNPFTIKIEQEIEQLKAKPNNRFCKDFYNEVAYHINEFYKPLQPTYTYGRFGKTQLENNQWKENLESNLYSAYAEKFIQQAFYVLRGNEWRPEDLRFIQAEKNLLQRSKLLVSGSPVDNDFKTIQSALNKYNEIESFISSCRSYSYSVTDMAARFPITDVQKKISRATSLRNNRLGNEYVNNCTRLHNGLKEIPLLLFRVHVRYLDNKIIQWSNMYPNYNTHRDYVNNLFTPLKQEIDALDNEIYNVAIFDNEYQRLLNKWRDDNVKAFSHEF